MTDNNLPPWMYATNWHDLLIGLGGVVVECKLVKCDDKLQVQPRCDDIRPCPWSTKINIGVKDE